MIRLAIFASGSGSNARQILEYFKNHQDISVDLVFCNKAGAGVLAIAESFGIPAVLLDKQSFFGSNEWLFYLRERQIDYLILAGFLWLVPLYLVESYQGRIFNIHPALLPKFGGKGMYGMLVHEAVKKAGETETGITIHLIDDQYDRGTILFQARCPVEAADTAEDIRVKVLALEHRHYPQIIEKHIIESTALKLGPS